MFASVQYLRHPDGSYWTGWQFANQVPFPRERSSWTAAAVVLAADALAGLQRRRGDLPGRRVSRSHRQCALVAGASPPRGPSANAPDFSARW